MKRIWFLYLVVFALCLIAAAASGGTVRGARRPPPAAEKLSVASRAGVEFTRDIRPLLAQRCYACHGAAQQKGGLRLDRKAEALAGGASGPAIRPGRGAESLLIRYVAGLDPKIVMPPAGERLSTAQVRLLRAWIDQGAPWPDAAAGASRRPSGLHWAFRPPRPPEVPAVPSTRSARNPIDAFILARLEKEGIAPSPEADRGTLIRRLSLDLLGLPPAPAEVDAFVRDPSPDAYERLVDRLLASPRYGERWGRHWLDLARYADSDGYEKDTSRPYAYFYRDWVIRALNRDLPFDQFTVEQLAGDLLPNATLEQKTATGFHRNTLTNKEGGVDPEEFRVKAVVDRVNTTGTVWLGLTAGCAECHNHKYDPISQREYYGLFAFFNSAREVDIPTPTREEVVAYEQAKKLHDEEHARLQAAVSDYEQRELSARKAAWEQSLRRPAPAWTVLRPERAVSTGGAVLGVLPDGSIQATGARPATDTYTLEVKTDLAGITAFRLEVLPDPVASGAPSPGVKSPAPPNFVLSEFQVRAGGSSSQPLALGSPSANYEQKNGSVLKAVDGNPKTGWDVRAEAGQEPVAVFETGEDLGRPGGTTLTIVLDQQAGQTRTIGRLRISATTAPRPVWATSPPPRVAEILAVAPAERTAEQAAEVARYYRALDPGLKKLEEAVADHTKKAPVEPPTRVSTLAENPTPPATHVHVRGDFLRKGDAVTAHTPAVLPRMRPAGNAPSRLDLARWLIDPANPLTARVAVNRVWQHLFGRGLVATTNDFGTRGEPPSHPELLDWLACQFMATNDERPTTNDQRRTTNDESNRMDRMIRIEGREEPNLIGSVPHPHHPVYPVKFVVGRSSFVVGRSSDPYACGWSMKKLLRLIVTSATYRQSSRFRPELAERDPKNVLLARQNRFRVEAEILRDLSLATSGLLNPTIGGPSIRPPLPPDVAALSYASGLKWEETKGPERYKRGMYIHWQRTVPFPSLMAFDEPDGNVTCTRRERSNSPLQALTLLNDAIFFECAQALGRRIVTEENGGTGARLRFAFRLCLAREPTATELARLRTLYGEMHALCRTNPDSAAKLAGGPPPAGVSTPEAAAWVTVARTLLNLDEFVTRE